MGNSSIKVFTFFIFRIPAVKADNIPGPVTHEVLTGENTSILIKWNAPPSPNGLIILYEVFYKKVGDAEVNINKQTKMYRG